MPTELTTTELTFVDLNNMPSMDDLLGNIKYVANQFSEGSIVSGKIAEIRDNGALIDIGFKSEGFINKEEFKSWNDLSLGDEFEVLLEKIEDANHMPEISLEKAEVQKAWNYLINNCEEGQVIKGKVKFRVKGGLIVDIGVEAFLPGSHIDITPVKNLDDFIDTEIEVKVLKINLERKNIIISRRELLEAAREEQKEAILKEIVVGDLRKGVVKNITDFGAFIDLTGMDGLLHITDMSWGRVTHPSEMVSIGDELEVMILEIDTEKRRVSLGLKQKSEDPWLNILEKHPISSTIKGKVVNIMPYGAFIEIAQGIEGLIHVSEMSWSKKINKASDVLVLGEEIEAVVLDIKPESKKISLGLRQTIDNPWEKILSAHPIGSKVTGTVRSMTSYGAFIEIADDIDGMIHVSDMSWTKKITNPKEAMNKGDKVEAIVLEIDPEQQRISLGIKQLEDDPWNSITDHFVIGDSISVTVNKLASYGVFVAMDKGIEGLIHITEIDREKAAKLKESFKEGDLLQCRIIEIDAEERRISLSLKPEGENVISSQSSNIGGVSDIFDSALEGLETSPENGDEKNNK